MAKDKRPPTKYTPEKVKAFLECVELGMSYVKSCGAVGWSEDIFAIYRREHTDFSDAIKKAESRFVQRNVSIIRKASRKTWTAAAWLLERRVREEFSNYQNVNVEMNPFVQAIIEARNERKGSK